MSLLLVVVLLFFSSSSSVSSHQYYVSDDCSSVTHTPCNPLSVYAGNMSQYNNSIFYFIKTSSINNIVINAVKNVTLHGLDQSRSPIIIDCLDNLHISILINNCDHVIISSLSFSDCAVEVESSNNITITNISFIASRPDMLHLAFDLMAYNTFDLNISSCVFIAGNAVTFKYDPLPVCSDELPHYSLILTSITFSGTEMELLLEHGTSYNVSVIFDHVYFSNSKYYTSLYLLIDSIFSIFIINSSFHDNDDSFSIEFIEYLNPTRSYNCTYPGIHQLISTLVIENSQFYCNSQGLEIKGKEHYIPGTVNYYIIIKSCFINDNINEGLFIDGTYLRLTQIDIIDTELNGNGGNKVLNSLSNPISLSNITVANSTSTGLSLKRSLVTVKSNLMFQNNTGVVGGGLAINDSSKLILSSSAFLEFIDNYASYKGGGIYVEEYPHSDIIANTPNIPLTLINNIAGLVGDDMYGYYNDSQLNLTNPYISSNGDAFDTTTSHKWLQTVSDQHIYPGQALKVNVALIGTNYFRISTLTDGIVQVYDDFDSLLNQTYIPNTCSMIEYTPKQIQTGYKSYLTLAPYAFKQFSIDVIKINFMVKDCPIGFSVSNTQGFCTCSQSVSRKNVTCDINSLNITHNGLLWIGTYHTSKPFNANATNSNACIINEDCLLYCSPNPVTFKLNDTDTQCVDNRGQRMCGSCTEGYSLLMGSNKCGQCHDNYMVVAWIALFAVMGVLLVVLLIALNLTVSVGTLNGLLFYANIVKLYEPVFSRKGALPVLSQVVSWINLDFGFEICFYNGMDSYAKQWLQFAFPLYLWIIIIIIIQLCRRYGKISRLMGSHAVPVLSTLTFLSYTKLVRTIVIVLHKREAALHCTNESVRLVSLWYEDPNVEYAKGKHAGLFGFALLVTVFFVIPYTLFLLLNRFYEKYLSNFKIFKKFWSRFKPIIDAYSGPMKDEFRFWPGLLLVAIGYQCF
uniref:Right handed beta helix domain-containing protein n=1 Tax=Amphimedon queenslandica TaxID=400682 RepID=A0A1X7TRY4_AMPQE